MRTPSLTEANIKHLRESIELAAWCTVTLQEDRDNWSGELHGYYAFANRDWETRAGSATIVTASAVGPIETLDKLARALGVDVSGDAPALVGEVA